MGETKGVNPSFQHICSLLNCESGKTSEREIKEKVGNLLRGSKSTPYPTLRKDGTKVRKRVKMMT